MFGSAHDDWAILIDYRAIGGALVNSFPRATDRDVFGSHHLARFRLMLSLHAPIVLAAAEPAG
jgi:hypothetical protein